MVSLSILVTLIRRHYEQSDIYSILITSEGSDYVKNAYDEWEQDVNRHFTEEEWYMIMRKNVQQHNQSMESTVRYYFMLIKLQNIKYIVIPSLGGVIGLEECYYIDGKHIIDTTTMKTICMIL